MRNFLFFNVFGFALRFEAVSIGADNELFLFVAMLWNGYRRTETLELKLKVAVPVS